MLRETNNFPVDVQAEIVTAICIIYNFIRFVDPDDTLSFGSATEAEEYAFQEMEHREEQAMEEQPPLRGGVSRAESERAVQMRDTIARAMWDSYQEELR